MSRTTAVRFIAGTYCLAIASVVFAGPPFPPPDQSACHERDQAVTGLSFKIYNDVAVIDTRRGLMWKRCPEGRRGENCTFGNTLLLSSDMARTYADEHHSLGYADWRLPKIEELVSIADICREEPPFIRTEFFPYVPGRIRNDEFDVSKLIPLKYRRQFDPYTTSWYAPRFFWSSSRAGLLRSDILAFNFWLAKADRFDITSIRFGDSMTSVAPHDWQHVWLVRDITE